MLLRLTPTYGGNRTVHGIIAMNDTGSDILTLFNTDLALLGNVQGYTGWRLLTVVGDGDDTATAFRTIAVQVQPVRDDNTTWGDWIERGSCG